MKIIFIFLFLIFVSSVQQATSVINRSCRSNPAATMFSATEPMVPIYEFCINHLRELGCQPLSHLRNYIYHSFGSCLDKDGMINSLLSRPECKDIKNIAEYNRYVEKKMPEHLWPMIRAIREIEAEKNCFGAEYSIED